MERTLVLVVLVLVITSWCGAASEHGPDAENVSGGGRSFGRIVRSVSRARQRRQSSADAPDGQLESQNACVVRHIKDGVFKEECRSIKVECDRKQCPGDTVCGLDLDEIITCFDASVRDFQNCGPDSFRLQQPCPADAGIRGFGMGCNFCEGYSSDVFLGGSAPPTLVHGSQLCLLAAIINYMLM